MDEVKEPAQEAATEATVADTPADVSVSTEAKAEEPAQSPQPPKQEASTPAEPKEPFWYRKALSDKERANKEMARRLEQLEQRLQQSAPTPQLSPEEQQAYQAATLNIRISERFARKEHGALFEEARDWLATRPDVEQWAQQQDDPWDAAINLYKREKLAAEIGDDPAAYRARIEAEIRAQFEQQAQAQPGQGMTAPRLPQSAAGQRSAAPKGPVQQKSPFAHQW
jgi:hypothetical protein